MGTTVSEYRVRCIESIIYMIIRTTKIVTSDVRTVALKEEGNTLVYRV